MSPEQCSKVKKNIWRPVAIGVLCAAPLLTRENDNADVSISYEGFESQIVGEINLDDAVLTAREIATLKRERQQPPTENELLEIVNKEFEQAKQRELAEKYQTQDAQAASAGQISNFNSQPPSNWSSREKIANDGADVWTVLADCESGDGQVGPPYYANWTYDGQSGFDGAYQFLPSTWSSLPVEITKGYEFAWQAPPEVQTEAAIYLQARGGWGQWPSCTDRMRSAGYIG